MATEPLDVSIESRISTAESPDSPKLGIGQVGLRIAARNVTYLEGQDELRLELMLSYGFPMPIWNTYKRLLWAIHATVEDAATGRGGAVPLKDPFVKYENEDAPNFQAGLLVSPDPSPPVQQGFACVPLLVRAPRSAHEPSIFVKTTLREHTSNTLSVNLRDLTVLGA